MCLSCKRNFNLLFEFGLIFCHFVS
jgi:hypothetical protein